MMMIAGLPYSAFRRAVLTHPTLVEGLMPLFSAPPGGHDVIDASSSQHFGKRFTIWRRRREGMSVQELPLIAHLQKHAQCEACEAADDWGLVAQAKSGSSSAFGELYERHRVKVYNTIFRLLRQREDAEDAVQRCFQRAFANLARFRGDSRFSTWVTRIAINEALTLLRQRRANTPPSESSYRKAESPVILNLADEAPTPEQTLAANELSATLVHAISGLRKNLRIVVLLREFQGLTNEETAQRLGLTVAAVKARLVHARRWLRRRLERKLKPTRKDSLIRM
jgi:RNA polymerase sigma-70 factor (ECF subfamily)